MRKKALILFSLTGLILLAISGPDFSVDRKTWDRIDSLENQGLYRSALRLVDQVYIASKSGLDPENEIRALIYKLKYIQELEEEGQVMAIATLTSELPDPRLVQASLKHTMLAELYFRFFTTNRWNILQNPPGNDFSQPLLNWSPEQFYNKILAEYDSSMRLTDRLTEIRTSSLTRLWSGNISDTVNHPDLYSVLISRALGFLQSADDFSLPVVKPDLLCSKELLGEPSVFKGMVPDSASWSRNPYLKTVGIYADLLSHSSGNALVFHDLNRLDYIHRHSCHPLRDSLYRSSLIKWVERLGRDSANAIVHEKLAEYHIERGSRWQVNNEDTVIYRSDRQTARDWLIRAEQWERTMAGKRCRNSLKGLLQPELTVLVEPYQLPGEAFPVSIEFRNLKRLGLHAYKLPAASYYTGWSDLEPHEKIRQIRQMVPVLTDNISLPDNGDLNSHRTNWIIDPLGPGFYLLAFFNGDKINNPDQLLVTLPLTVSRIAWLSRLENSGDRLFYLRDRETGAPIMGYSVFPMYSVYNQNDRKQELLKGSKQKSGKEGQFMIKSGGPGRDDSSPRAYRLHIQSATDTLVTQEMFYPGYRAGREMVRTEMVIFTDRSIYKPGDRLFFRGVLLDRFGDSLAIHQSDSVEMTLQDPRYQVVATFVLPVDAMGVLSGSILLPFKGLTGSYRLLSKYGQATIRMEQYRRPGFSVTLDGGSKLYRHGDSVTISGKVVALSGEPVPDATVIAEVNMEQAVFPRRWTPRGGPGIPVTTISTVTDSEGYFYCTWKSYPASSIPFGTIEIVRYSALVRVTDLNGESHQEDIRVDCGNKTATLTLDFPDLLREKDSLVCSIGAVNSDGRMVRIPAKLVISKLADPLRTWSEPELPLPDRFTVNSDEWNQKIPRLPYRDEHKPSSWPVIRRVESRSLVIDSVKLITMQPGSAWKKGWYRVDMTPDDPKYSSPVTRYFQVEDENASKVGLNRSLSATSSSKSLLPGEDWHLYFGSGKKGYVLVEIQNQKDGTSGIWYSVDRRTRRLSWKVTENWRGGSILTLAMIRDNRLYRKSFRLDVPWIHSSLQVHGPETIGDVRPGDTLQIQLRVTDAAGNPVVASLGMSVYDASLDEITLHTWNSLTRPPFYGFGGLEGLNEGLNGSYMLEEPTNKWIDVPYIEPISLNWFGMGYFGIHRQDVPVTQMAMGAQPEAAKGIASRSDTKKSSDDLSGAADAEVINEKVGLESTAAVYRKDFRETAFFTGNTTTDPEGVATFKFRIPDVFTEWKILAISHDTNASFGKLEKKFRSNKPLMLKPNIPGYMRLGDTIDLSTRLGWYGKEPLRTRIGLVVVDSTGNPVGQFKSFENWFSTGEVLPAYWSFSPDHTGVLTYRITAESKSESDALIDTLAVLPDQIRLWKAQPFFLTKPVTERINVGKDPLQAVFEVTTTPAWQILQSLPVVTDKERDCSEYWFSRFYLACIVGDIADKYPVIANRFLGDSVAPDRQDRVNQVRQWMDPQLRLREQAYVLEKLLVLQNPDGSWPWFKGMGPDLFMTQQIIAGFGELKSWGVFDIAETQQGRYVISKAIEVMDKWMYNQFRGQLKRDSINSSPVQLNPLLIHYLYSRSYYAGFPLAPASEIAWIHYMDRVPIEWNRHEPGLQALLAISGLRLGRLPVAYPIYKSLRERARVEEQWGMYWPRKGHGSSWFEWDLWMQSRMIELFSGIEEAQPDLENLKTYLIHQKRGREWNNGLVAAWASRSLLFYGNDMMVQPASVEMRWGEEEYSPVRIKTGGVGVPGYYRFEWKTREEIPGPEFLTVTKKEGGPAWGTLYTLHEHKLNDLEGSEGPLQIFRQIQVRNKDGYWTPVRNNQQVGVGERLRITLSITADRELSYLEIKDFLGSGVLPVQVLSGFQYSKGLFRYQSREPEAIVYYLPQLPKGVSVIEYEAIAEQAGRYSGGYATITSLYAPEFRAWSGSIRLFVKR